MKMPLNSCYTLEICVDSPKTIFAAASIADRIELCTGLELGGLTPDYGLMVSAAECGVETHVLIRACAGDFCMNNEELATASTNIGLARQLGLKGVVIGAERAGKLDLRALEHMVKAADGLDMTLHRVIDVVDDPITAVSEVVDLGFTRILTSGGKPTALEGIDGLRRLHEAADNKIEIMAGGGSTAQTCLTFWRTQVLRHSMRRVPLKRPSLIQGKGLDLARVSGSLILLRPHHLLHFCARSCLRVNKNERYQICTTYFSDAASRFGGMVSPHSTGARNNRSWGRGVGCCADRDASRFTGRPVLWQQNCRGSGNEGSADAWIGRLSSDDAIASVCDLMVCTFSVVGFRRGCDGHRATWPECDGNRG